MVDERSPALEDVLACDFRARPRGAPTLFDVLPAVRQLHRSAETLTVEFEPAFAAAVSAFVGAERQCCTDIGWDLEQDGSLRLRISAKPGQLEVLEQLFTER